MLSFSRAAETTYRPEQKGTRAHFSCRCVYQVPRKKWTSEALCAMETGLLQSGKAVRVSVMSPASKPVRKAVFPVAGMGTRFLPATKAVPKEMLPVVDKPVIQYAVEEAREAGIEQFVFITGRGKHVIADHFDHAYELESLLEAREKTAELNSLLEMLPQTGSVGFVRQQQPLGLGHAVWCARHFVGNEPFAVLLPDDLDGGQAGRAVADDGGLSRGRRRHHRGGGRKARARRPSAMAWSIPARRKAMSPR